MRALQGQREQAVADLTEAIKLEPSAAPLWQERAKLRFRMNKMAESVADFDRAVRLRPESEPYNWERGIALYYAGYFSDGRRQFESHQTVNSNDVENAVWHFLCVVRAKGLEEARKNLIPIQGDTRVPMKEVHDLFAGKGKVEDVLAAAQRPGATPSDAPRQQFYAHLYLGLYFEAISDPAKAREHIVAAAQLADSMDYMGDVARVHALRLEKPAPGK
jgi:lipoprotein NlpI